jgi:hypothetical protein
VEIRNKVTRKTNYNEEQRRQLVEGVGLWTLANEL